MGSRWDIVSDNIVCHLVGLNSCSKQKFIDRMEGSGLLVKDIDQITHQIRNTAYFLKLYKQAYRENNPNKKNGINSQLHTFWKKSLHAKLTNILTRHKNTGVILLGLSTFHKDHRVRLNISTPDRYFVRANDLSAARQLVGYNLDKYRNYIVSGSFPLKYIDTNFLASQRGRLQRIYQKMGYKQIGYEQAIKKYTTLGADRRVHKRSMQAGGRVAKKSVKRMKSMNKPSGSITIPSSYKPTPINRTNLRTLPVSGQFASEQKVEPVEQMSEHMGQSWFIGSARSYTDTIKVAKLGHNKKGLVSLIMNGGFINEVTGYDQPWLAALNIVDNVSYLVEKGFQKDVNGKQVPFVRERQQNGFKSLQTGGYLYRVDWDENKNPDHYHKHRFTSDLKINKTIRIDNLHSYLKKNGVKLIPHMGGIGSD